MSSAEFTRWVAWYRIADGRDEKRDPTPDELGDKFRAAFAVHNAKVAAKERGEVKR